MRAAPKPGENRAWRALREICGAHDIEVRRQVPIGNFIVDFLVPSLRLVIEIDGGYHAIQAAADERRDAKLRRAGYTVVRLQDS